MVKDYNTNAQSVNLKEQAVGTWWVTQEWHMKEWHSDVLDAITQPNGGEIIWDTTRNMEISLLNVYEKWMFKNVRGFENPFLLIYLSI